VIVIPNNTWLQKIAVQQGIELDGTPLVQFFDLNSRRKR